MEETYELNVRDVLSVFEYVNTYFTLIVFTAEGSFSASKRQRKRPDYQIVHCQLYHRCLELVFAPLKPYMTKPRIMKCLDGHFRRTIFSLGLYIADYPEQVWLSGIVSNWCPK